MTLEEYFAQQGSGQRTLEDVLATYPDPNEVLGSQVASDIQDYADAYADQPGNWVTRNVGQPTLEAARSMASAITAPFAPGYSKQLIAQNMGEAQALAETDPGLGAELTRGVVGSLAQAMPIAVLSGPAAPVTVPAAFGAMRANEAYTEGRMEGLDVSTAMTYAAAQGTIEAALTMVAPSVLKRIPYLNKILGDRAGGIEVDLSKAFTQPVAQGFKGAVKQMAQRGAAEVPEELAILASSAVVDYMMGVNPEQYLNDDGSFNIEKMLADAGKTAAVAMLTGGSVEAGGQVTMAARNRFRGASSENPPPTAPQQPTEAPVEQDAVRPSVGPTLGPEYVQTGPNTFDYRPDKPTAPPRAATIDEIAEGEPSNNIGELPDSILAAFPDLPTANDGLISLQRFTTEEREALRRAGLVQSGEVTSEGVDPERLWQLRKRAQDKHAKASAKTAPDKAVVERRAQFYDKLAKEQEDLGELGDQEAARGFRAKANEIRESFRRQSGPSENIGQPRVEQPVSVPDGLPAAPVAEQGVADKPTPDLPAPIMQRLADAKSSSRKDFVDTLGKDVYSEYFGRGGNLDNKATREAILAKAKAMTPPPAETPDVTGTGWTIETAEGVTQLVADDGMTVRNFDTPQEAAQYAKANPFVEEGEAEQAAKEPWEMTYSQLLDSFSNTSGGRVSEQAVASLRAMFPAYTEKTRDEVDFSNDYEASIWRAANLRDETPRYHTASISQKNPGSLSLRHKQAIQQALAEGKPVPAEVLADYPDLQPAPIDDRATALLPEVNDDPARAVPLPDLAGRGEKPPVAVAVQKRVEALKKTDKEYRAAKKALDIAQKSSGMSDATRANPPQVSGPVVIEPKVTFTTPTGESVTGQGYALPGLEKLKVVLVPPSGNKAKGTKRGWSVYLGGQLVESNNLGAGDTAEAALNGASRKLLDAERRGLLKAIGKGVDAAEISAAQDRLDAATERLMEKAQGQAEAPPKPTEAELKTAKRKVSAHGLDKEQEAFLTKSIRDGWDDLPETPGQVDNNTRPLVIEVPGDGTFTITNQRAANAIHFRVTGKYIKEPNYGEKRGMPLKGRNLPQKWKPANEHGPTVSQAVQESREAQSLAEALGVTLDEATRLMRPREVQPDAPKVPRPVRTPKKEKATDAPQRSQEVSEPEIETVGATNEPWQMTLADYTNLALSRNKYRDRIMSDSRALAAFEDTAKREWVAAVEKRAEVGRVSDAALDDWHDRFGNTLMTFRGTKEKGIKGWMPPDIRSAPAQPTAADADKQAIRQAYQNAKDDVIGRAWISDIRKQLPDMPKETFDKTVLAMQQDGELLIGTNQNPMETRARHTPGDEINVLGEKRDVMYMLPPAQVKPANPLSATQRKADIDKAGGVGVMPGGLRRGKDTVNLPKAQSEVDKAIAFDNAEAETRYNKAYGIAPMTRMERVLKTVTRLLPWFRSYAHIPQSDPFFASAREIFRLAKEIVPSAKDDVARAIGATLNRLGPNQFKVFERKVFLENAIASVERGEPIPSGFKSLSELRSERDKIDAILELNPTIKAALDDRAKMLDDAVAALVERNLLPEEAKERTGSYYHQQVVEKRQEMNASRQAKRLRPSRKSFQKRRTLEGAFRDESMDYNTSYIEAETAWLTDAMSEIRKHDLLEKLLKRYDAMAKIKAKAKEQFGDPNRWRDVLKTMDGYVEWQPVPGNYWYKAMALPERMAEKFASGAIEAGVITKDDLREVLAMGAARKTVVLPKEIADQLDDVTKPADHTVPVRFMNSAVKMMLLVSPQRFLGYQLRSFTGDLDAVIAGAPGVVSKMPAAGQELFDYYYSGKRVSLSPALEAARNLGVITSNITNEEINDIKEMSLYRRFGPKPKASSYVDPLAYGKAWFEFAGRASNYRENIARYAAFVHYREALRSGKVAHYGGAKPETVRALVRELGPDVAAAHLARNLLGDYGNLSLAGQWLRSGIWPFWSWVEVNLKRYPQMLTNAVVYGPAIKDASIPARAAFTAAAVLRMGAFYGLTQAWNYLMFPDEEDKLSPSDRAMPHIILGRLPDGDIHILRNVSAIGDFAGWFGINTLVSLYPKYAEGTLTLGDMAKEMGKGVVNKAVGGVGPFVKAPFEMLMGKSMFPDVFNPVPADRGEITAGVLGLQAEYRGLRGWVLEDGSRLPENYFARLLGTSDPKRNAINEIYAVTEKYRSGSGGEYTANRRYRKNMRDAFYAMDSEAFYEAFDKWRAANPNKIRANGTWIKGARKEFLNSFHPLNGISKENQAKILNELTAEEARRYRNGLSYAAQMQSQFEVWLREYPAERLQ